MSEHDPTLGDLLGHEPSEERHPFEEAPPPPSTTADVAGMVINGVRFPWHILHTLERQAGIRGVTFTVDGHGNIDPPLH